MNTTNNFIGLAANILVCLITILAIFLVFPTLPIPGNYKVLTVLSGSMEPAIQTGAVVVVKPAAEYNIGDVITFKGLAVDNALVTHRISDSYAKNNEAVFITKGDANETPDKLEVKYDRILGRQLFSIPYLGYILEFMKKPAGFALVAILPASTIVLGEAINIKREIFRKQSQNDKKV